MWCPMLAVTMLLGPLPAASPDHLVVKPGAHKTLVNPPCSHCRDEARRRAEQLRADDPVLCWVRGKYDGGAIPIRFFLNPYRVISDTYGVFVYDPDAGFARGFAPSLDFTFYGWRNGVMVMKHRDGTLYSCLTGIAFAGPRKGSRLTLLPTQTSTWGHWLKHYPGTVAYHMFDKYQPTELPTTVSEDSRRSRGTMDKRLRSEEPVLGVAVGATTRAYPLAKLSQVGLLHDRLGDRRCDVLWFGPTHTAAAYEPVATPPDKGSPVAVDLVRDDRDADAPFVDKQTRSRWDITGRATTGKLKGWTLGWLDGTQVKWYAWAAEYPRTTVYGTESARQAATESNAKAAPMIAGAAEVLSTVPKRFARVTTVDIRHHRIGLIVDGDKLPKVWNIALDAEIRVAGWWGRLSQFHPGDRVWVWLSLDRKKQPAGILMLADEVSERHIHGKDVADFKARQKAQEATLRQRWQKQGLPGTVIFTHLSGELEFMADHEAMHWARSLKSGDRVTLATRPPIESQVRLVRPWRERTQIRLVVAGADLADLHIAQRVHLKMTPPPADIENADLPPDLDRPRSKSERVDWFLASIYCPCGVTGDLCTGDFYTLASCNPNGCGMPKLVHQKVSSLIDRGLSDRQIMEALLKEYGPGLLQPHLRP